VDLFRNQTNAGSCRALSGSRAIEWAASGRFFPAEEAMQAGLVREIVPKEKLLERATEIAREVAECRPVSVAMIRAMMWRLLDQPLAESNRLDTSALMAMARTPDTQKGFSSFLEKRKPDFPLKPSADMPAFYPWWKPREEEWGEAPLQQTPRAFHPHG
jgi:1,4-dihydroxy-2-naphthoyl-CoA synthase